MTEIIPVSLVSDQGVLDLRFSEPETIELTLVRVIELGAGNLAAVAYSGDYDDLNNKPIIPSIPNLAPVALSGSYVDLVDKPFIPVAAADIGAVAAVPGSRLLTNAEGVKLSTVAPNATANSADSVLLYRPNHTGEQPITTVTGLQAALNSKVDKVPGKGLSDTNFSQAEKDKLAGLYVPDLAPLNTAVANLQATKVDKVAGKELSDTNFTLVEKNKLASLFNYDDSAVVSDIEALETGKVDKVAGKQLSTNDYSDDEKAKLASLFNFDPTALQNAVDTLDANKVDKVAGKGLSANDYTDAEKTKLASLFNFDPTSLESSIASLSSSKVDKIAGKGLSANDYTNADVAKLAGIAPGATANSTDATLLSRANHTGTQPIATVAGLQTALDSKVNTLAGFGLSSNDFTAAEKAKLASLESSHFRGTFPSFAALVAGVASPSAGDYADVDQAGANALRYIYDATETQWVTGSEEVTPLTSAQIKELYEDNPDTNAYTDAEKAKLASLFNYDDSALTAAVTDLEDTKVDKITGKGLSDTNFTQVEKDKLASLFNYDDTAVTAAIADLEATKVDIVAGMGLSANDFTNTLKAKLDGIAAGATVNSPDATLLARANHTGVQAISTVTGLQTALDSLVEKVAGKQLSTEDYTTAEKTKLAGIATGATANDTDANLKNRANHTGTQAIATVSGLQTALDSKTSIDDASITATTTYSSNKIEALGAGFNSQLSTVISDFTAAINSLTSSKVDKIAGKGLSTNDYTTTEQTKLAGIADGATANSTDAALRDRATHTGDQAISTVTGLQAALDQKTTDLNTVVSNFTITATNLQNTKVDKVTGKQLSTEDYSTVEKAKLATMAPAAFSTLAIAATMDIGAVNSETVSVTSASGAIAISSLGTAAAGTIRTLVFTTLGVGAKSITHNSTSLILPGAANLSLTVGTVVSFVSLGSGNWIATNVTRSNGQAVVATPFTGGTLTSALNEAAIVSIASGATMDLTSVAANTVLINSGSTGIDVTSLGVGVTGMRRTLINNVGQLTFKASSFDLIGTGDLVSGYGDVLTFVARGSSIWTCTAYVSGSGKLQTGSLQVGTAGAQQAVVDIAANSSGNQLAAPIKLHAGTNMLTPENGAIEFDGTNIYITIGGTRKTFVLA